VFPRPCAFASVWLLEICVIVANSPELELKSSLSCGWFLVLMTSGSCSPLTIPLSRLPAGAEARVHRLEGDGVACQRLREMGFCESAIVCRVSGEHSMVCQVCGTRVALHRMLAEHIHVEPLLAVGV
jgi:ferrous iron transport protein A